MTAADSPIQTAEIIVPSSDIRDDLAFKYKEDLLNAEVFTYKDSKRFGTSVLIGKMLGIFCKTAKLLHYITEI